MVPDQFPFWKLPCTSHIELTNVRMTSILIERLFTQLLGGGAGMTEYWISGTYVVVDCRISYTPQSSINKHARITSPDFSFRPSFYGMAFGADTLCFIPSKIREHKEIAMHFCIFRILPRVYFSKRWFINDDQMVFLRNVCLIEFNAFAYFSQQTKMFIVSSTDFGKTWEKEYELHTGKDLREPYFLEVSYTSSISWELVIR